MAALIVCFCKEYWVYDTGRHETNKEGNHEKKVDKEFYHCGSNIQAAEIACHKAKDSIRTACPFLNGQAVSVMIQKIYLMYPGGVYGRKTDR